VNGNSSEHEMTLCMAWRSNGSVHFASDSRLTVARNSYTDVGIKVSALPFTVLEPAPAETNTPRRVALSTELGMCLREAR